jgi:NADH:ubiquinone oxidoreductase subunit 6 (subunit J)
VNGRRPLVAFMLVTFAIGAALMLLFDATITRVVGLLALCSFVISGVFLIADPEFLERDDDAS